MQELDALHEIRAEQRLTGLCFAPDAFATLCREIGQDYKNDLSWEPEAFRALQVATEAHMLQLFRNTNLVAIHAGRDGIMPSDMQLVRRLRSDIEVVNVPEEMRCG